jgi:hypothetical protein
MGNSCYITGIHVLKDNCMICRWCGRTAEELIVRDSVNPENVRAWKGFN